VPNELNISPTIIGHEFAGIILEVGPSGKINSNQDKKFSIQPAMNHTGILEAPDILLLYRWRCYAYSYPDLIMEAIAFCLTQEKRFILHPFLNQCLVL